MPTFFSINISQSTIILDENDSRHAIKSLRLKSKDQINIIDGRGTLYTTEIIDNNPKKTIVTILNKKSFKADIPLQLAFCPTKNNDKNELVVEKAVEIGVTKIFPVFSQNSERRKWNSQRMEKICISALKQSGRYWLPEIHQPCSFKDFITSKHSEKNFIAHCKDAPKKTLSNVVDSSKNQLILIGPEGDFTVEEIELALKNNFYAVDLGKNRLRTETACLVALALMKNT